MDDKPSSVITWNKVDKLRRPVRLNVGKDQRKAGGLRSSDGLLRSSLVFKTRLCKRIAPVIILAE